MKTLNLLLIALFAANSSAFACGGSTPISGISNGDPRLAEILNVAKALPTNELQLKVLEAVQLTLTQSGSELASVDVSLSEPNTAEDTDGAHYFRRYRCLNPNEVSNHFKITIDYWPSSTQQLNGEKAVQNSIEVTGVLKASCKDLFQKNTDCRVEDAVIGNIRSFKTRPTRGASSSSGGDK